MGVSTAGRNAMLNHFATLVTHVSLHSGDPGDTGANEISGGSPAYARKSITWAAASGGALDSSNAPVFDVPGSVTVSRVGMFSALTGGTFHGFGSITPETFASQGTYTLDDLDVVAT